MDGESWGLSLSQFTQLSSREQVLLLVPEGDAAAAVEAAAATAHRVAKLIAASVQPGDRQQLLMGLVQADAPRHLPWCVHIFERLRLQRQVRILTLSHPPHPTPRHPTTPHPTPPHPTPPHLMCPVEQLTSFKTQSLCRSMPCFVWVICHVS